MFTALKLSGFFGSLLLAASLAMALQGCGGDEEPDEVTVDSLLKEVVERTRAMAETLSSVQDRPTAEAAAAEGQKIAAAILAIAERMEKLPPPEESEKQRIGGIWQQAEEEIKVGIAPPTEVKDKDEVRKIMSQGMQEIGGTLEKANAILEQYGIDLVKTK